MSLESFFGADSGEPMSEASFEKLREQMAAAAAQIQAIKKEEGKQKKKEDEIHKILLHFVQTSQKTDLTTLIARVLAENLPANFILAIILLGNPEIQQKTGQFLMLKPGEGSAEEMGPPLNEKALIFFTQEDASMPLKLKIEIDNWIKNILLQADENPQKLVKTGYEIRMIELEKENHYDDTEYRQEKIPKDVVVMLMTYILFDFLADHDQQESNSKLREFCRFIYTGILKKTEETLDGRKFLGN